MEYFAKTNEKWCVFCKDFTYNFVCMICYIVDAIEVRLRG